ncbi:MAG: PAS domain-containing protein, partial [Solirubrobacteraceae bacterium]
MWHSVVEGAFDAIVTMDMAGTIVNLNPAAERMFGYPREQTIGGDLGGLVVPDDCRDQYRLVLERARSAEADAGRFEMQALRRGAQRFPIELCVSCTRTPSGEVLVAWIRDLSERRVAEEALRLSEMQL